MKYVVIAVFVAGVALLGWKVLAPADQVGTVVEVPDFTELALAGQQAFNENCAACHGTNASGTNQGPPLVHDIYNPGHHPDEAFHAAAARGVPQHHWPFGAMPPQPQVTNDEIEAIVRFVRELQTANGIVYRPHRM